MSDETGERDDELTIDDQGVVVNRAGNVVQPPDRSRETYEAWKAAEDRRRLNRK